MKHTGFEHTAAALLVLAVAPGLAAGPAAPGQGPEPFDGMDTDRSGFVSPEEFQRAQGGHLPPRGAPSPHGDEAPKYADIDTDHDGRVSREEFQAHRQQRRQLRQQEREERHQERMEHPGGGMSPGQDLSPGGDMGGGTR